MVPGEGRDGGATTAQAENEISGLFKVPAIRFNQAKMNETLGEFGAQREQQDGHYAATMLRLFG